jgi:hypothetical protein
VAVGFAFGGLEVIDALEIELLEDGVEHAGIYF